MDVFSRKKSDNIQFYFIILFMYIYYYLHLLLFLWSVCVGAAYDKEKNCAS